MMDLRMTRFLSDAQSTLGIMRLDGITRVFTLEDEYRTVKVMGETRIPAGIYRIKSRLEGGMVGRYRARHPWHKGMLHLQSVPGFRWVYIHIGNTEEDTAGCVLAGHGARLDSMTLQQSTAGYRALYEDVYPAAEAGRLQILIEDRDR